MAVSLSHLRFLNFIKSHFFSAKKQKSAPLLTDYSQWPKLPEGLAFACLFFTALHVVIWACFDLSSSMQQISNSSPKSDEELICGKLLENYWNTLVFNGFLCILLNMEVVITHRFSWQIWQRLLNTIKKQSKYIVRT